MSGLPEENKSEGEKAVVSMDDLANSLGSAFNVSSKPNDPTKPHPRFTQYKSRRDFGQQEKRRRTVLDFQKSRRDDFMSVARDIASGNVLDDDELEDLIEDDDSMDTAEQSEKRYRFRRSFCNQLMESEWMVDVPEKLATDWLLVPVPEGRRAFLVASGGTTSHFSRSGHYINSFPSLLPGGCRKNAGKYGEAITFLDCIYVQIEATYYVLDVMIWNDFSYYECDTEFRRFWIKSKVSENPELTEKSRINPYMFKELEASPCDSESLKATLLDKKLNFDPLPLDGLLFYHKKVNYLPGSTPLVGWLKGYMVPEVLGTPVSEELMRQKPNSYASMKNYIQSYAEEELKKPRSRKNQKDDMDDLDSTLVPDPDDINKDSSENKTEMELKTK